MATKKREKLTLPDGGLTPKKPKKTKKQPEQAEVDACIIEDDLYKATSDAASAIEAIEGFALVAGDPKKAAAYAEKHAMKICTAMFASSKLIELLASIYAAVENTEAA